MRGEGKEKEGRGGGGKGREGRREMGGMWSILVGQRCDGRESLFILAKAHGSSKLTSK